MDGRPGEKWWDFQSKNMFHFIYSLLLSWSGLRDVLLHLVTIILKYGARSTGEPELRQRHYKNLVEMIDFVLSSRRSFLESIKDSEKHDVLWQQYETQRSALIYNFGKSWYDHYYYLSQRRIWSIILFISDSWGRPVRFGHKTGWEIFGFPNIGVDLWSHIKSNAIGWVHRKIQGARFLPVRHKLAFTAK